MSRFTAKVRREGYKDFNPNLPENKIYVPVDSFNEDSTLNKDTKYLIVGTLTPPKGRGENNKGYFYCSPSNKMYSYVGLGLEDVKNEFNKNWDSKLKEKITNTLRNNHIAFLDVVEKAYAKKDSSRDDDIIVYKLDTEKFKDILKCSNLKIAANSINAYEMLLVILEEIRVKHDVEIIPQQVRGYKNSKRLKFECNSKEDLKREWNKFFGRDGK